MSASYRIGLILNISGAYVIPCTSSHRSITIVVVIHWRTYKVKVLLNELLLSIAACTL